MSPKIKIVTGKIHSGKTTSLFRFISENENADGILAPIVNEKRIFYHISSKTIKNLEVDQQSGDTISVGKYIFLNDSFEWANKKLIECFNSQANWLIIDEIGKLELRGEGLHKSTKTILENLENIDKNLILVIRDYLLEDALKYYKITEQDYELLNL